MKIVEKIFLEKLVFPLGESIRNVYTVLIKGKKNCLIDTGTAFNYNDIVSFCEKNKVNVKNLDLVILTHCHPDHIGSSLLLKKENPDLQIMAHSLAKPYIEDIQKQYQERPVPGFFNLIAGQVKIDRVLNDGDEIDTDTRLQILHTPGHSPGSISIFLPEEDVLIIGDAVPGTGDIPIYENVNQLRSSFTKLEKTGATHIISAFNGYCTDLTKLINGGREDLNNIDNYVEEYLEQNDKSPVDLTEISGFVLQKMGFNTPPIKIVMNSIESHLQNIKK